MKAGLSDVERAHAIYTKRNLAFYDWWVLGFSNRRLWHCATEKLVGLYRAEVSTNHLEVGVGTGYLLEHSLPAATRRLALLDINPNCLDRTAKRLKAHAPEVYRENVLEPLHLPGARFDSIGLNYVLHCLPGRLELKGARVLDHLVPHLDDDGVLFGSTILGKDLPIPFAASMAMALYNRKGVFSNREDSLGGMMEVLSARFRTFSVEVHGCVVLFWGRGLREAYQNHRSPGVGGAAATS
jgi:hypothetical protein